MATTSQDPLLEALSAKRAWTRHKKGEARKGYYEEQEARTAWAMDQAVDRGLMDPDMAEEAKQNNVRTWWDKLWGFEQSSDNLFGGFAQPIVDVLSLGNYAMAAVSQGTIKDPLVQIGSLKVGMTPSAFRDAWAKRPSYGHMMEGFLPGLAFDIAMDPMTYLSFGVGAGMKVEAATIKAVGNKALKEGTRKLTMTRHGAEIYQHAVRKYKPIIDATLKKAQEEALEQGADISRLVGPESLARIHDDIGQYMVDNYGELAAELYDQKKRWAHWRNRIAGSDLVPDDMFGFKAEDMFRETASAKNADIGIDFTSLGKRLTNEEYRVGKFLKNAFPNFHRKFGVPEDVQNAWFVTKGTIEHETARIQKEISDNLGDLSPEQLRNATFALEAGEARLKETFGPDQKTILGSLTREDGSNMMLDAKTMEAVAWAKQRFKEIIDFENANGFKIDNVEDYVNRVYKTPAARDLIVNRLHDAKKSVSLRTMTQSFRMHRVIASLDEAIDLAGEEAIELNLGKLLMKRQAQSIRMVEMENFYDYLKLTSGITPMITYQLGKEGRVVASGLKKILDRSPDDPRIVDVMDADQVYLEDDLYRDKLGFFTGESNPSTYDRNIGMLKFMRGTFAQRQSDEFADIRRQARPNGYSFSSKEASLTIEGKGGGVDFDLADMFDREYNGDGVVPNALKTIANSYGVSVDGLTAKQVADGLRRIDNKLRDEFEAGVNELFPDFVDRVIAQVADTHLGKNTTRAQRKIWEATGEGVKTRILKVPKARIIDKAIDELKQAVPSSGRYVPQVPEEMLLRAKFARMRYGDYSDTSKPSGWHFDQIQKNAKELGMNNDQLLQVAEALLNVKSLDDMSSRGADKLNELLLMHAGKLKKVGGRTRGNLFNTMVREIDTSSRGIPTFPKMAPKVAVGLEKAEDTALDAFRARARINSNNAQRAKLNAEREALLTKHQDNAATIDSSLTKVDLAQTADLGTRIEKRIQAIDDRLADLDQIATKTPTNKAKMPRLPVDARRHIAMTEVVAKNADQLTSDEIKKLSLKSGVEKKTYSANQIFTTEDMKPSWKAKRKIKKKLEEAEAKRKEILEVMKALDDTTGEKTLELNVELKKIDNDIKELLNSAYENLPTSKVTILNDGKYLDQRGRVQDIIVSRKPRGKGRPRILGKNAEEIKKALLREVVKTGGSDFKALMPALKKDVPDTVVGSAGGKYLMPKEVVDFVEDLVTPLYSGRNEMIDSMLKMYDRIQNAFKVPLLAPWFSSFSRNAIGNVSLVYLKAGLGMLNQEFMTDYIKVMKYTLARESPVFRGGLGKLSKDIDSDLEALGKVKVSNFDGEIEIKDLVDAMGVRGVFSGWMRDEVFDTPVGGKFGEAGLGGAAGALIGGSVAGPYGAGAGAVAGALLGKEAYRMRMLFRGQELASEIPTRVALALHTFKDTGSLDHAGNAVRKYLHDYSELSTFERRYVRRAIPFYNFTKLAFRVFGEEMFEHPARVLLPQKVFTNQNINGLFADQGALPEDVPDYFHNQMKFLGKDIDEETGELKTWVWSGLNLPIQEVLQLADIAGPGGAKVTEGFSRTSFLATSVGEYLLNYDSFRGGAIYPDVKAGIKKTTHESGNAFKGAPDWMKALVQYRVGEDGRARVNPKIAWLIGEIPTSRFVNVSKKIWDAEEDEAAKYNYRHLASSLLGVNTYKYDPETQQYYMNKGRVDAMTQLLANLRLLKSYDIDSSVFKREEQQQRRRRPESLFTDDGELAGQRPG